MKINPLTIPIVAGLNLLGETQGEAQGDWSVKTGCYMGVFLGANSG